MGVRIIGLGNGLRGDDAVGLLAARRLQQILGDRVQVIEADMAGANILELMDGARVAILVDAARSGQAPGTIHRLDVSAGPIAGRIFPRSSHAIGALDALELARALGTLPASVVVYGVEAAHTGAGEPLSPPVAQALDEVVKRIVLECEARDA